MSVDVITDDHKKNIAEWKPGQAGHKLDTGKLRLATLLIEGFGNALKAVAEVGEFGTKKYALHNWHHLEDGIQRYDDAEMRHFFDELLGEKIDPDSGLLHKAHRAWCALASLELEIRNQTPTE